MELFFLLLAGHALGDFGLQGDWVARHKSHKIKVASARSQRPDLIWVHVLGAHCLIHGGLVAIITGVWWLGLLETLAHMLIDYLKSDNRFGFHTDQALHVACKVLWTVLVLSGLATA